MLDDQIILKEFQKAIHVHSDKKLIDFDRQLKNFDFVILRFEDVFKNTKRAVPPNKWSFFRIGLLTKGSAEFNSGMYRCNAKKNTLMIMPPRMITASRNWSSDAAGYVVLFNLNFFVQHKFPPRFFRGKNILHANNQPFLNISQKDSNHLCEIFEAIIRERKESNDNKSEMLAVKMIELILICEKLFTAAGIARKTSSANDVIKKFNDVLEGHFSEEHSVSFYARRLNYHPNYLNALLKKHTGFTAKESIQNRLLIETKYLLHTTDLSIKEISLQSGFSDPDYFTAFFKKFEKISPAVYRSSLL